MERSYPSRFVSITEAKRVYLEETKLKQVIVRSARKERQSRFKKEHAVNLTLLSKRLDDHYKRNPLFYRTLTNAALHRSDSTHELVFRDGFEVGLCSRNGEFDRIGNKSDLQND